MSAVCDFTYVKSDGGRYFATCAVCGREVKTRTTKAVASCRINAKPIPVRQLMQSSGVVLEKPPIVTGPGTELKAILRDWLGIEADAGCSCNSMAARMDALGHEWCESDAGMAEILGVMRTEHAKRWADGRTKLPWTDLGAKQLVRLACRQARKKAAELTPPLG